MPEARILLPTDLCNQWAGGCGHPRSEHATDPEEETCLHGWGFAEHGINGCPCPQFKESK